MVRSLPEISDSRLCKLPSLDRNKAYITRRPSKRIVEVLEQGSRVFHRQAVDPKATGDFVIERGWLINRTYPRAEEDNRIQLLEAAETRARIARERARVEGDPEFKKFVGRTTRELGSPRRAMACDQRQRAFPAPGDTRCAELIQEARASGASATLFLAPWGRELRVIAGRVGKLAALFDWSAFGPGTLEPALDALDRDAGLTLDHVWYGASEFSLHLDRVPKRVATYAAVLANHLDAFKAPVVAALRARVWTVGPATDTWSKITSKIYDPGHGD